MNKITKIEPQKRKGRVNIYIEGEFSFGLSEMLVIDYGLYVGKTISKKDIKKYKEGDNIRKCADKAYSLLATRQRSEKEIRDKLLEKFNENNVEACIKKLKEYKYIDDTDFANRWVSERSVKKGKRALKIELKKKGIAEKIIEEALLNVNEDTELQSAILLVSSKKKYQNLSKDEAYKKIGSFLSRRGYSYSTIKEVIKKLAK